MHRKAKTSSNYVQILDHYLTIQKKKMFLAQKYAKIFGIRGKLEAFFEAETSL